MPTPDTLLGGISLEAFLETYWQKKPLLIRGAFPGFVSPVTPEELMDIACEEDADARLVLERGGDYPWQLLHGPFEESFYDLPETHWTLLVQEVNRYVPAVADLLDSFRFVPNWRLDDVMISYATAQGGVGAHIDNYDVFLLQAQGHRRWEITRGPVDDDTVQPDLDISILEHFEAEEDWVLGPGDMLYLPPRVAHRGTAINNCMTFSIGFRAPAYVDLISGYIDQVADRFSPLDRYSDPDLRLPEHPGEITPEVLGMVRSIIQQAVADPASIDDWFGRYITEPRRGNYAPAPEDVHSPERVVHLLREGVSLRRSPSALFAFAHTDTGIRLYISGVAYPVDALHAEAVYLLTGSLPLNHETLAPFLNQEAVQDLLTDLVNEGYLEFQDHV
ncbi:MAG: cupin domain-containing protein [Rhodothermales bacterium]